MHRKLIFITAIVFILNILFSGKATIQIAKAMQEPSSCQILPEVKSVAFSPDSKYLAAVGDGPSALIWDVQSGKKLRDLPYQDGGQLIYHVAYSPNGEYIAASKNEDTALWDAGTGKLLYLFKGSDPDETGSGMRIAFTPDSHYVLVSDAGGSILWDVQTGSKSRSFSYHVGEDRTYPEQLSPNGKYLLADDEFDLLLWDVQTGELIKKFGFDNFPIIPEATFLPDGENILIHVNHAQEHNLAVMNIWNIKSQKITHTMSPIDIDLGWYFSPNGKYIMITTGFTEEYPGGLQEIWDLASYKRLLTLTPADLSLGFVTFLPDSIHFLVEEKQITLQEPGIYGIWNIQTAQVDNHLAINEGDIDHTALSPNHEYIAVVTGETGGTLEIRDGKTLQLLHQLC